MSLIGQFGPTPQSDTCSLFWNKRLPENHKTTLQSKKTAFTATSG